MPAEKIIDVTRGSIVESSHFGHIAVVDLEGNILYSVGDPHRVTYARSSSKPLQAIPVVESGAAEHYNFSQADIALICASHSGETQHTERVSDILSRIHLPVEALQCGTHIPHDQEGYKKLIREGGELTPLHSNCSGKHSGMLTFASHIEADPATYREIDNPVQVAMRAAVADMAGMKPEEIIIGTDGCGVPVFGLPLDRLALAFAKLSDPSGLPEKRRETVETITSAMIAHPEMVAGTNRFCTELMGALKGRVIGKAGAEGVYTAGVMGKGIGIAVKVEDGNIRAAYPAVVGVLEQLGFLNEADLQALQHHRVPLVKNMRQDTVGELHVAFTLGA